MPPLAPSLLQALISYKPSNPPEHASLSRIRDFVLRSPSAFSRANPEGHITASAVVTHPEDPAFLLVWHRKLNRWLQPGGHMEDGDVSVFAAALREAREETGLEHFTFPFGERILDLDVHPIPAYGPDPPHFHFDIRYVLTAANAQTDRQNSELRWFTLPQAMAAGIDDSLARALRKAAAIQRA